MRERRLNECKGLKEARVEAERGEGGGMGGG